MDITVIDDSDTVGWAASATRIGEIYMKNVQTMVDNVIGRAGNRKIRRLNILDHGNADVIQIGSDTISRASLSRFTPQLARLRPHFASDGFVHLQHCQIGRNKALLKELSRIWGVPVYAGTGNHNPVYRFNFGDYVRCQSLPNGATCSDADRPD